MPANLRITLIIGILAGTAGAISAAFFLPFFAAETAAVGFGFLTVTCLLTMDRGGLRREVRHASPRLVRLTTPRVGGLQPAPRRVEPARMAA
jgi:hypothetical protein